MPLAAQWVRPTLRRGPLRAYGRETEIKTLELLEAALFAGGGPHLPQSVERMLLDSSARDIDELRPQLEPRAADFASSAERKLRERGEAEAKDLRETLERQQARVQQELEKHEDKLDQMTLGFDAQERRELEANMRAWRIRLGQFKNDLEQEPGRIRRFYEVRAKRVEPVGLVYLWPDTN